MFTIIYGPPDGVASGNMRCVSTIKEFRDALELYGNKIGPTDEYVRIFKKAELQRGDQLEFWECIFCYNNIISIMIFNAVAGRFLKPEHITEYIKRSYLQTIEAISSKGQVTCFENIESALAIPISERNILISTSKSAAKMGND